MATISPSFDESAVLSVSDLNDVRSWGWTPLRPARELNDFRVRSVVGITTDAQRQPEEWGSIHFDYPDTWRILTTGPERIVGY